MGTDPTSRRSAARPSGQRSRPPGGPQRPADGDQQRPLVQGLLQGLLQAAAMAPDEDETAQQRANGIDAPGLPLIQLPDPHLDGARHCVATTVNDRGRLADQTPLKVMQWPPGTPITIAMIPTAGIIVVRRAGADATGTPAATGEHPARLPDPRR